MELVNEFVVPLKVADAWVLLTDVERIAPCMPGALLTEHVGEKFRGTIQIKIGPVTPTFIGEAAFVERDESQYRAILSVDGRDMKGQGYAKGVITASLYPQGAYSKVVIETSLVISGRMAQFGRGVVGDISDKLFKRFVFCLEHDLLSGGEGA